MLLNMIYFSLDLWKFKTIIMKKLYTIIALFSLSFLSAQTLFFSEYAEGSSNNKYLEIYNPTNASIDLSGYAYPSCSNGCNVENVFDYWNDFKQNASIPANGVYIIAHPSADPSILAIANETFNYLSNGDDFFAIVQGDENTHTVIDKIGEFGPDPGDGWNVAGVTNGTVNRTLVRKSSVTQGNIDWTASAGTNANDSEWIVYAQDTWTYLGGAPGTTLAISSFDGVDVAVYPNPVQTKLNFSGLSSPVQATVFDMLGKRHLKSEVTNSLNVSQLKSGLYMVEIKNENSAKVFNILKK